MKTIKHISVLLCMMMTASCSLFQLDNYDAPSETLRGEVVDAATGEPVLTDQGSEGIRVRLIFIVVLTEHFRIQNSLRQTIM